MKIKWYSYIEYKEKRENFFHCFSNEYPTTMMPVLTTPREARSFDFVPVNIIHDDGKETSFRERNFGDFSDVSLIPAGTNSRIQVRINHIDFSFNK